MNKVVGIIVVFFLFGSCTSPKGERSSDTNLNYAPKNVILMIGDGMGFEQIHAAMLAHDKELNIEMAQYSGLVKTYASDNLITDSGAGGTALATGYKTFNGAIGVDASGNSIPTILELASQNGYLTGVVATSSITHATPASFFAHQQSRKMDEEIASDLLSSGVDVFMGGGSKFFQSRSDGLNLIDSLFARGYYIAKDMADVKNAGSQKLGLFIAEEQPTSYLNGREDFLPEATAAAIEYLSSNDKGFFLIVEGSQIDWGGHNNDKEYVITEMLDFDRAIGKAFDLLKKMEIHWWSSPLIMKRAE